MRVTGTVSDFDAKGGFGLIVADDGELLPFSTLDNHPALRDIGVGSRVIFSRQEAQPVARATGIVLVHEDKEGAHSPPSALRPRVSRGDSPPTRARRPDE
jgi:cold shock CspA family protein